MEKDTAYKTFEISQDTPMAAINKLYLQKSEYYAKQLEDLKNLSYLSAEQTKLSSKLSLLKEAYIALGGYIDKPPIQPTEQTKLLIKPNLLKRYLHFFSNSEKKSDIDSKHITNSSILKVFVKTTKDSFHYYVLLVGLTLFNCSFFLPVKSNIEHGYIAAGIVLDYHFEDSRPLSHFFVYVFYNFSNLSVILMLIFTKKKYYKKYVLGIPILGMLSTNYWWILSGIGNLYSGYWFWVVGQFLISCFFIVNFKINKNSRGYTDKPLNESAIKILEIETIGLKGIFKYYKKNTTSRRKNIIIFLIAIGTISAISYFIYVTVKTQNRQKDSLNVAKLIESETQIGNLQEQIKALQLRNENAENKLSEISNEIPFIISSITFENSAEESDYKKVFNKNKATRIGPVLSIVPISNNWSGKIKIKCIDPNLILMKEPGSPKGFSFERDLPLISSNAEIFAIAGIGNDDVGVFFEGKYEVEIWYNNKILGKETFKIEE